MTAWGTLGGFANINVISSESSPSPISFSALILNLYSVPKIKLFTSILLFWATEEIPFWITLIWSKYIL